MNEYQDLQEENKRLRNEVVRLRQENAVLRGESPAKDPARPLLTRREKIDLFVDLFRGRRDVFALRWESRTGKPGYSPAHFHDNDPSICRRPKRSCKDLGQKRFLSYGEDVAHQHLTGRIVAGVYPLLPDDTCLFLAVDFDKSSWEADAHRFRRRCSDQGIPCYVERSRSGNGAHVWIFFSEPVPARDARALGTSLLSHSLMDRYPVAFDSFDRLFPNQDTLPKGGFGNLIALPLQREPRNSGNSVFIDEQNVPYPDQWAVLAGIERVSRVELTSLLPRTNGPLDRALKVPGQTFKQEKPGSVPIPLIATKEYPPESPSLPWNRTPSGDWLRESVPLVLTQGSIKAVRANLFFVEKQFLPARLRNQLLSIAAFGNPEYHKAQKMRLPVWNKPRVISCGEDHPDYIGLPRGCEDEAIQILRHCNASVEVEDRRNQGTPISITFVGELTAEQSRAVQQILKEENGVLCAPTGFGKTVAAASVIAGRARNTLVLVHRKRLAQQWVERLREFLDLQEEEIGVLDPKRRTATRVIDVALVQGLIRNGVVDDVVADYGNVVVDECHHVSAFSFEEVLKRVRSTYVLGLTATPVRQDGRHPIIHMQCGPIRYRVDERAEAQRHGFEHGLLVRETSLRIDEAEQKPIHEVYQRLVEDDERNILIADDIVRAVERGRVPLVLSERKRHLQLIKERIEERGLDCTLLVGGMGKKRTAEAVEMLHAQDKSVLLATGKLIGEGFDHPQLDTLFLTFPVSWKGVVQQYVGRIHRRHAGKDEVRVYDYVDRQVPVLAASFKRRAKSYRIMGYKVKGEESDRRD